jgi:kynurenine 3-monooxygenase
MGCFTIIGAGPVGALMALLLARRGHRARLFERREDPRRALSERSRSINLALSARGIVGLAQAEVLERLRGSMISMPGRMLHDERQHLEFMRYGQNELEVNYAVSREQLNRVLIEAAAAHPAVELHFNRRCIDIDPRSGLLQLRDDRTGRTYVESTELLLGADGAGSTVRKALLDRSLSRVEEVPLAHDYKEFTIPAAAASVGSLGYVFEAHALHIWPRGGFMLIALPNTDRSFTSTLFLPREGDHSFAQLTGAADVRRFFHRHFVDAAAAIPDLAEQFEQHPQSRLGTVYCEGWHAAGRVLLLGDSAHAIVPFHGQGLNCGFEDCVVLDRMLAQNADTLEVFAAFERERRPNAVALAAMALENYVEMRDDVRSARFAPRKALAAELERQFPGRFIPRYSMVTFHPEISYAEARRRGAQQELVLDHLSNRLPAGPLSKDALTLARQSLDQAGL